MPFTNLLKQLVSSVEGATGALILESDGEAVQWYSRTDGERLRLRSAYLVTVLKSWRAATESMNLGGLGDLVFNYDGALITTSGVKTRKSRAVLAGDT